MDEIWGGLANTRRLNGLRQLLLFAAVLMFGLSISALAHAQNYTVTASGSPNPVVRGQDITYTVQVQPNFLQNSSSSDTLTIPLPANLTFVSLSVDGGSNQFTCTTPPVGSSGTVSCHPTFTTPSGGLRTFTLVVNSTNDGAATRSITATWSADQSYVRTVTTNVINSSATALSSSPNPSQSGQAVTFTATVTGASPTGTVTFKDGAATLGAAPLSGGIANFTTSSLSIGSHSITATYNGDANNAPSTSAALNQVVGIPADSVKLQALQVAVTKIEAQGAGQATSGAIDAAIADGFSDNGQLISGSDNGVRFNFAAEPERRSPVEERVGDTFAALGYARREREPVFKAPVTRPQPKEWLAWLDVRGTGWSTSVQAGDIRGGQVNALAGLTRRVTPDFLLGVFGGYETFDYTSQLLNGRLKGEGWTAGGYLGWRLLPGLRFDAGVARSGIGYDGQAGTALGTFPGQRWLATLGLTGTYKAVTGLMIEPSAKVYALWEHEDAYTDTLGIAHAERSFSTGRASAGVKVAYPWLWSAQAALSPYLGLYGDYYFNRDDAVPLGAPNLLPTEYVHGLSARVSSGIELAVRDGPRLSLGGELGGLGNDFKVWTVKGRAAVPF